MAEAAGLRCRRARRAATRVTARRAVDAGRSRRAAASSRSDRPGSAMATYIIRVARRAGIVILFTMAAVLGLASGVFFAYAGDLPQISALDDYAPSTISRVYGAHGEIVGEFAIQRREVIPYEAISPRLRQAILAAEDADVRAALRSEHPAHRRHADEGHRRAAQGRRRQHADAAARPQAVPDRREDLGAQDQGSDPRHPDREALHEERDLHALLQPDVLRPRRLRRARRPRGSTSASPRRT